MSIDFNTQNQPFTPAHSGVGNKASGVTGEGRLVKYLINSPIVQVFLLIFSLFSLCMSFYGVYELRTNPIRPEIVIECPPKMIENLRKLDQKINEINQLKN